MAEPKGKFCASGNGENRTHAVQYRVWLDPTFALANYAKGANQILDLDIDIVGYIIHIKTYLKKDIKLICCGIYA